MATKVVVRRTIHAESNKSRRRVQQRYYNIFVFLNKAKREATCAHNTVHDGRTVATGGVGVGWKIPYMRVQNTMNNNDNSQIYLSASLVCAKLLKIIPRNA